MKKNKGVFICLSGNGGLNIKSIKRFIDTMACFGYDNIELGLDDMFKIKEEPYFGYLRGGYSEFDLIDLDNYAKEKGIELIPSSQFLGHFGYLCKIPEYENIIDIDDILLIDEPRTYVLIENMFKTLRKCFTSKKINIAFDEAHHVGLGKYLDKHGYVDRFDLLLRHLNKVLAIAKKYGFSCHMWSDMFFKLANKGLYYDKDVVFSEDILKKVPKDIGLCYWDYYSNGRDLLDSMFKSHLQFDRELYFAGSISTCNGFAPSNIASLEKLKVQLEEARKFNINNYLIALWPDNGNDCSYFAALPGLFKASLLIDGEELDFKEKERFKDIVGVSYDDFLLLDEPNRSKVNPALKEINLTCKSLLYNDPFLGWKDFELKKILPIDYEAMVKKFDDILPRIPKKYKTQYVKLRELCNCLVYKYDLGILTREAYQKGDKEELKKLLKRYDSSCSSLIKFKNAFYKQWMEENIPHGFDVQDIRLGGLYMRLKECKHRLDLYIKGKIKSIPELEEKLLPYAKFDSMYNSYRGFATVREI
ncbi:MAG TPA: hypothetical protein DD377_04415 [Firmicutes bacterium]|nr:hypothetical protein [Bacillota bacterium]